MGKISKEIRQDNMRSYEIRKTISIEIRLDKISVYLGLD